VGGDAITGSGDATTGDVVATCTMPAPAAPAGGLREEVGDAITGGGDATTRDVATSGNGGGACTMAAPAARCEEVGGDTTTGDVATSGAGGGACASRAGDGVNTRGAGGGAGGAVDGTTSTTEAVPVPPSLVPPLVQLLAGNPVTSITVFACLTTADVNSLRRLHPALPAAVAGVPWTDTGTAVVNVVRWRKVLPVAVSARFTRRAVGDPVRAMAALAGVTHLDLHEGAYVHEKLLSRLPPSVRVLNVRGCRNVTAHPSTLTHLTALVSLDCRESAVIAKGAAGLPPSLRELDISGITGTTNWPAGMSLAHLSALRVLRVSGSALDVAALALLPPSLEELHEASCKGLTRASCFAHLSTLRILDISRCCAIGDASLATLPPSLVVLLFLHTAEDCSGLTRAAALPPLPALRVLHVSHSYIGDALLASLPAGLVELQLMACWSVTPAATLDHLPVLRALHSSGTNLAPGVLAACRARGCIAPAAGCILGRGDEVSALAALPDGRLAVGDKRGQVRLWDVSGAGEVAAALTASHTVCTLAALPDGHHLAVGTKGSPSGGYIEVWDVVALRPARRTTIDCGCGVRVLAVLADGRLAAGCQGGKLAIVDCDAGAVVAVLEGHTRDVTALAALPDRALASGSTDGTVRVWDVGARSCVATLVERCGVVWGLAVLADGRLACATSDNTVQLWDVGARACVGVLSGHTAIVRSLVALPDGRLVTGCDDATVRVWDIRPAAAAASSRAAATVPGPVVVLNMEHGVSILVVLPDGRLACGHKRDCGYNAVVLLELPPPAAIPTTDLPATVRRRQ